jgi:hypothetical protein
MRESRAASKRRLSERSGGLSEFQNFRDKNFRISGTGYELEFQGQDTNCEQEFQGQNFRDRIRIASKGMPVKAHFHKSN